jgi:hypothetical protein
MSYVDEVQIPGVVAALRQILETLNAEDPETAGSTVFTYGNDWTLVFATADRAKETLDGVRKLYGIEEDNPA